MNEGKNASFNSVLVLSDKRSTKPSNGTLIVNGGIGIGKNIVCKEEILANELITRQNVRIGKNLYVMGTIESESMFQLDNDRIVFRKSIIGENENIRLGTPDKKWSSLDAIDIDFNRNLSGGTNTNDKPILTIDNNIKDTLVVNGSLAVLDNNLNSQLYYDQKNNIVNIKNIVEYDKKQMFKNTKYINITNVKSNIDIDNYNIVLLTLQIYANIVEIDIAASVTSSTCITKIILYDKSNDINVKLRLGKQIKYLKNIGDYVEIVTNSKSLFLKRQ